MSHLTLQNMNGVGHAMRGLSAPLTIEIDHGDMRTKFRHELAGFGRVVIPGSYPLGEPQTDDQTDQEFGLNLDPSFAPWWKQVPPPADMPQSAATGARANPERGEAYVARDAYRQSFPYTPSNDERNLPSSYTGKPIKQLPHRNYPGSFPHGWIDYANLVPATGPEMGPTPSGWEPAPMLSHEEARAVDAAFPSPWAGEEAMTRDISGFGSLHEAFFGGRGMGQIPGLVVSLDDPPAQAATAAVTQQAQAAQAAGASPDVVSQIVNMGSSAAALYLQKRQIDAAKDAEAQQRALLAAKAATVLPRSAAAPFQPGGMGTGTVVGIGVGVVAVLGAIAYAMRSRRGRR